MVKLQELKLFPAQPLQLLVALAQPIERHYQSKHRSSSSVKGSRRIAGCVAVCGACQGLALLVRQVLG